MLLGAAATDPEGRRRLAAQSAATEWDMVIVPQSLFTAIGVSDDLKAAHINKELDVAATVQADIQAEIQQQLQIRLRTRTR